MAITLSSKTITDIASITRAIASLGGTYAVIEGSIGKYQSAIKGINLEFELKDLANKNDFSLSYAAGVAVSDQLSLMAKGKKAVDFSYCNERRQYCFGNGSRELVLDRIEANLMMPTIDGFTSNAHKIGVPVAVDTKGQLGINGKGKSAKVVIRDETFTGVIIDGQGEHFFVPASRESMVIHQPSIFRSNYFLAIGKEKFSLQIFYENINFWLLTAVKFGLGIQCRMLEKLTTPY